MEKRNAIKNIIIIYAFLIAFFFVASNSEATTGTFESMKYKVFDKYIKGITCRNKYY